MGIASLSHIVEFFKFGDKGMSDEDKKALVEEALLMTLARATSADCNIDSVEVATVQTIMKEVTGADVSLADIRVAALSDMFKEATVDKYLAKVRAKLDVSERQMIARSLAHLIKVDGKVSPFEVEFFNMVCGALALTSAELAGLTEDTIRI
ncbi:TerB family tellurite resistance protein [Kordiimonas aquimaris]|uniref:TerB family tellurite resistance protein n=1 Tax=Kordiimonas aquimaris TaxID=707591 RepID=UPI0021D2368E|nr:TerB family tellurite resistance protein [Kordiimonas aquimaris]